MNKFLAFVSWAAAIVLLFCMGELWYANPSGYSPSDARDAIRMLTAVVLLLYWSHECNIATLAKSRSK